MENLVDENMFYVFVRLNDFEKLPDIWVVPAKVVADFAKYTHKKWMSIPRMDGGQHKDNDMRNFQLKQQKHSPDNWEQELEKYKGNIGILEGYGLI